MGVRGDYAKLAQLEGALRASLAGELKRRLLNAAAAEAKTQVALGFREARAPSGEPWKPLARARKQRGVGKRVRGGTQSLAHTNGVPLRKTGRLANSYTAKPTATGIIVGTNVQYAQYHQYGTRGHKAHTQTRHTRRGRFISKAKMNKLLEAALDREIKRREEAEDRGKTFRRSRGKGPQFGERTLNFREGGGKIPARPMVPEGGFGPIWGPAIERAIHGAFNNFFSRIAK